MSKIIEMIQNEKYDDLKTHIEEKVAKKVAKKVSDKKAEFIERMRLAREGK